MKAEDIYKELKKIVRSIYVHDEQMVAIARWIEAEFEYKHNLTRVKPIKCITFDKAAQDNLPQHIKDKMKAKAKTMSYLQKWWEEKHPKAMVEKVVNVSDGVIGLEDLIDFEQWLIKHLDGIKTEPKSKGFERPRYEYITELEYKKIMPTKWLNKRSAQGWELVAVVNDKDSDGQKLLRYHFKKLCE
jgi:hypothetical protein